MTDKSGYLVLVVGPSGAGKDSLLRGAANRLASDRRFVFPRRFVTRLADKDAEDHITMSEFEFSIAVDSLAFALWWRAHGNAYGIGRSIDNELEWGRTVVVNCSRAVITDAMCRYQKVLVVEVTAPAEVLVSRIVARGRETEAEAMLRVSRQVPEMPDGVAAVRIDNSGRLETAVDALQATLLRLQDSVANPGRGPFDGDHEQENGNDDGRGLIIVK